VLENIEIPGVTALNERGFSVRVLIKTRPGSQWMIQRAFNRLVKQRFDAAGIEIPYPHTVIHFGRDRDGQAAPVDFRAVDAIKEKVQSGQAQGGETSQAPQPEGPPVGAAGTAPTEAVEPRAPDIQQKAMEGIAREEEAVREGEQGRAPGPDAEAGGSGSRSRRPGRGRRGHPGPGPPSTYFGPPLGARRYSPMSSFQSCGFFSIKVRISSMQVSSCSTSSSTPLERRRSSPPMKVWFSPMMTLGMP